MGRKGFSIIIIAVALALTGLLLLPRLPVKLFPSKELPSLTVSFSMSGQSARVLEQEVTSRIEGTLARVEGVRKIESRSSNGSGRVTVRLDRHADVEKTRMEISSLMRQIRDELPEGVSYPMISAKKANKESSGPFMTYTVTSPMNPTEIESYINERVVPVLSDIEGVESVEVRGAYPMEWQLIYDADIMSSLGIRPDEIAKAIKLYYGEQFIGMTEESRRLTRIVRKSPGDPSVFDASRIYVRSSSGENIRLDKIVTVKHDEGHPTSYFRINGLNSIYLNITAADDANQLETGNRVRHEMESVRKNAPDGMHFILSNDNTDTIREELDKIYFRSGLTMLILLAFIIIVTRDLRYSLLITISLAINLAVAVIIYFLLGIEIQLYSLAGITISLNLIIDNTIVMCDHYSRRRDRRAFPAILAATLTTAGALVVVFLLDEDVRLNLEDFVAVVAINLLVSLLVALFLVPALADRMRLKTRRAGQKKRTGFRIKLLSSRIYRAYIQFGLRWRWILFLLMAAIMGASGYLFFDKVREGEYFNRDRGEKMLYVNASMPNGATAAQLDALMRRMEEFLAQYPEIKIFQTNVYSGGQASISIRFNKDVQESSFPWRLKSEIISKALTLGGGSWSVYGIDENGFSNDVRQSSGSYRIKLSGFNYDELMDKAGVLRDSLLAHRRIRDVEIKSDFSYWKEDYSEFNIRADRRALAKEGLTAEDFYSALSGVFQNDVKVGKIYSGGGAEPLMLSSRQSATYDIWALMNMPLRIGGKIFKLSDFAVFGKENVPQDIVKENQSYRVCMQFEYIGSQKQGDKVTEKELERFNNTLPPGYSANKDERMPEWDEKDFRRYALLAIVVLIIFFISAVLFNSLLRPLAIIAVIPMSYVGIFLTFILFDLKFDQGGFASFILLSGITVNAAIYLINEFDRIRKGKYPLRMYMAAFRVKIVPIMMTIISSVLGFIPFLLGTQKESFWFPLAAGTIGGLIFSLIAIILYLPLLVLPSPRKLRKARARAPKEC